MKELNTKQLVTEISHQELNTKQASMFAFKISDTVHVVTIIASDLSDAIILIDNNL